MFISKKIHLMDRFLVPTRLDQFCREKGVGPKVHSSAFVNAADIRLLNFSSTGSAARIGSFVGDNSYGSS
jgi:hypothetical protein